MTPCFVCVEEEYKKTPWISFQKNYPQTWQLRNNNINNNFNLINNNSNNKNRKNSKKPGGGGGGTAVDRVDVVLGNRSEVSSSSAAADDAGPSSRYGEFEVLGIKTDPRSNRRSAS